MRAPGHKKAPNYNRHGVQGNWFFEEVNQYDLPQKECYPLGVKVVE